jgi:hypothetical protein
VWERISAESQTRQPQDDVHRPDERASYCD